MMMVTAACSMDYPSRTEAESACDKWEASEKKVDYERELLGFEKRTKFEQDNPRPDAAFWDDESKSGRSKSLPLRQSQSVKLSVSIHAIVRKKSRHRSFWVIRTMRLKMERIRMKLVKRVSGKLSGIFDTDCLRFALNR